jgi:hypothetical protein
MATISEIRAKIAAQPRPELYEALSTHLDQLEFIQAEIAKDAPPAPPAPPAASATL